MSKTRGMGKFTAINHTKAIEIYTKEVERIKSLNLYDYVKEQYYIDTVADKTGYSKETSKKIILMYENSLNKQSIF